MQITSHSPDPDLGLRVDTLIYLQKPKQNKTQNYTKIKGKKEKNELLQKTVISPDFEKTVLLRDVGNYDYSFRKLPKRVTETSGHGWYDESSKSCGWTETTLQRTEDRISMNPKKFIREMIEMVFRLDCCWLSSCVYHSWIPEEQRSRIAVGELLVDSEVREENAEKMAESTGRICQWKNELCN